MSIEVKNINKSFEGKKSDKLSVLEDINLTINDGELVCLLGPFKIDCRIGSTYFR